MAAPPIVLLPLPLLPGLLPDLPGQSAPPALPGDRLLFTKAATSALELRILEDWYESRPRISAAPSGEIVLQLHSQPDAGGMLTRVYRPADFAFVNLAGKATITARIHAETSIDRAHE